MNNFEDMLSRICSAELQSQQNVIIDEIEDIVIYYPQRCEPVVPHVIRIMSSPIESIRARAFRIAPLIITEKPQTQSLLIEAYIDKLECSDLDVAWQALRFLPLYVNICVDIADKLISSAKRSISSREFGNANNYEEAAMNVIAQVINGTSQNFDSTERPSGEDGGIN
ncbi:hypothetical protein KIN20_007809 [Parelaphostrongylus tenuis]|uniref:Integrator complex subunit 1 R4 domain-containing protein n=1 Tax=Parelaphostrongylus tenuis TaxID=148309 RepID=A0AAD5M8L5_PARTN|nr:hypothetical protein KIN20_007809 [Parelaphostrongylus tenuis]